MSRFSRLLLIAMAILAPKTLSAADALLDEAHELLRDGRFAAAERVARAALLQAAAEQGTGSLAALEATDAVVESLVRGGKANDPQTLQLAREVVRAKEELLGPDHPGVASSLSNFGRALTRNDDFKGAIRAHERAVAIRRNAPGSDQVALALSLTSLGASLAATGDYEGAEKSHQQALAIVEEALGPRHLDVAAVLNNLGIVYHDTSRLVEARRTYERALAIREATLRPDHPDRTWSMSDLANVFSTMGDYPRARRLYEQALVSWERNGDRDGMSMTLARLGNVYRATSDFDAARQAYDRAIEIMEATKGPEHSDLAYPVGGLGSLLGEDLFEYGAAVPLLERARGLVERALGPESQRLVGTYHLLGYCRYWMGDLDGAARCYERARAIGEKTLGPEHPRVAYVMVDQTAVLAAAGDSAGVRRQLERALAIREKALGPEHALVGESLEGLAGLMLTIGGDPRAALPLVERSIEIREKALGPGAPEVAKSLNVLAEAQARLGNHDQALSTSGRALEILRNALGPAHPWTGDQMIKLGRIHLALGDTTSAVTTSIRGESITRDHLRLLTRTVPETYALRYALMRPRGLELALVQAASGSLGPGLLEMVWDAQVRTRAVVLDEMSARHRGALKAGDAVDSLWEEVGRTRSRLAHLALRGPGEMDPARYVAAMAEATDERDRAELALAAHSAVFAEELARASIGLDETRAALPPGGALVAYSRYEEPGPADAAPASQSRRAPASAYLAFVARARASQVDVVPLGSAEAIETAVAAWRSEVTRTGGGTDDRSLDLSYRRAGTALRDLVWDPVARHLAGAERVFIVPDGAIHLVNFTALPAEGDGYLVDQGPLLHRLSAERDLVQRGETGSGRGLLIVADPDFDRADEAATFALAPHTFYRGPRPACEQFLRTQFEPLPATRSEARAVEGWWRRGSSHEDVILLAGSRADEAAVKSTINGRRVVHLATHGFVLGVGCPSALEQPAAGGRGIGAAEPVAISAPPHVPGGENPLLLTGLALAGANRREEVAPGEEDGVLTAEELAALDLRGVEWAVLSACGTGMGELRAGEGVLGLGRAVQVAGARTLILSLWPVADEAAREWMGALYEARFARGLGTAEAVRDASRRVLGARRAAGKSTHPSTWAAFVAIGDWK